MQLIAEPLDLRLAQPFRIARSVQYEAHNVLARFEHDGITGLGEAAPKSYYGETRDGALAALRLFANVLGGDPFAIADIMDDADRVLHGNPGAKTALDAALYDWIGQRLGVPVYRLLGLSAEHAPYTSYTVSIDSPDEMARQAAARTEYPILKVKLGTPDDVATIRAIREATSATIRVDANAAWTAKQAIATINAIAPFGIELVEQPVARDDLEGLKLVRENVPVPIIADESCVTLYDIPLLVGRVDGINIKLMKCGGLHHALQMIHTARAHHLQVMIGCMIESSVAITAAAHLTPLVDYADLDGALLLADDPYEGATFPGGRIVLPDRPGLGIRSRADQQPDERDAARTARMGAPRSPAGRARIDEEC
jgi:L-Ala-D/L-Glu epimerase / N-acetyl-D-glutamate racemase